MRMTSDLTRGEFMRHKIVLPVGAMIFLKRWNRDTNN